jgi:hypothetical protein
VLGFGAFAWFSLQLGRSLQLWRRPLILSPSTSSGGALSEDERTVWQFALVVALASWYAHGVADYFYGPLTTNVGFWLVAGLALSGAPRAGAPTR